ncbi:MAG: HK97 family phage prohead protease, partial [Neisseriaceae bacterium]|nr:HK97 family phage prohead protease [Neisseriaceae bacterium]
MSNNTFIISDESVNSYGYIVKTDGIDTTAFERNPVMLYMHERKTVVGRWENIRKDGTRLLADAVFDESTELGRRVKNQVENGFLRSASIGVDIVEEKVINGVKTVTKSVLFEVSIVDIPANQNALKLYRKGNRQRLALELPEKVEDLRGAIISILGLDEDVTDEDIITEIQHLLNVPDEATIDVEEAIKAGFIYGIDRSNFLTMARIHPTVFRTFIEG